MFKVLYAIHLVIMFVLVLVGMSVDISNLTERQMITLAVIIDVLLVNLVFNLISLTRYVWHRNPSP